MATLQFNIYVSDDLRSIAVRDNSIALLSTYTITRVNVVTEISGLWNDIVDIDIPLANLEFPELTSNPTYQYTTGVLMEIGATHIFGDDSDFIYDNIYTVTIEIEDNISSAALSAISKNTLFPLSKWYKDNTVANYNYYSEDPILMKNIVTYQLWLDILDTATTYADSATISVILKSFKSLIDGYGLPGE